MTEHQKRIPTAKEFEAEQDRINLISIDNVCSRLIEKMGGMNTTDQCYDTFQIVEYLLRTAVKKYKGALELIKQREIAKING